MTQQFIPLPFSKEEALFAFKKSMGVLIERIYKNCVLIENGLRKKMYSKMILGHIYEFCSNRGDLAYIYQWMGIPVISLFSEEYAGMTFTEFYVIYSEKDGGYTILNHIINDLYILECETQQQEAIKHFEKNIGIYREEN